MNKEKFDNADLKIRELVKLVTIDSRITLIRGDLCEKYDELLLKYATELVDAANDTPKKSEMACNCCGDCEEETEKMEAISRTIDILIAEMEKIANQKKF